MDLQKALEIQKDAKLIKTDKDLLTFAVKHKYHIIVILDNDDNYLKFKYDYDSIAINEILEDIDLNFKEYFGNSEGVITLLDFIGLESEHC